MPGEKIGTGDNATSSFTPVSSYQVDSSLQVFVGGGLISRANYTYTPGAPVVFTANLFLSSTPQTAPGSGDDVYIYGNYVGVSSTGTANTSTGRDYTASELIASVQQRAQVALSARDFGAPQILRIFNEEIDGYLVPFVAQRKLEFWVESVDLAVTAGVATAIPSVAVGGKLRAIAYVQSGIPALLDELDLPMAVGLQGQSGGIPTGYYFLGGGFMLYPPQAGGTARIYYYRRPSMLVLPSQCLQVAGFPGGAAPGSYRVAFAGALPTAYAVGTGVDLVSNVPNFSQYATGALLTATATTTVDIAGTHPANLVVGDWICLAGTAPVITGSPADLVNLLIQYVALKVAEAKGTKDTVQRLAAGLAKAESMAGWTIQRRNDGAMRKLSAFPSDAGGYGWLYG